MQKNIKEHDTVKYKNKTIRRRGNLWCVRYRENGDQIYISAQTQNECLELLKEKLGVSENKKAKTINLIEWYNQWLKLFKIKKVSSATIKDYEKSLKHIPKALKNKNIKNIKSIEMIEMLNKIEASRARQKAYELLRALFNKAYLHKIVSENIFNVIEKPKHTAEKGYALNRQEQKKFIEHCAKYKRGVLLELMLYQGFRIGETLALTKKDVDLINNKVIINKSINELGEFDKTKNNSNRVMPIFDKSIEVLKTALEETKYKNGRIFNITYATVNKTLDRITKSASIQKISTHDLRHTFITNCKNENIPEHVVQSWVGHEIGSKVTSSVYTHVNEDVSSEFFDKLNNSDLYKK